jgi:ComF family protein
MLAFKTIARKALDTLLPPRCPGTGAIVDAPGMVSADFWTQLSFIDRPFCDVCGMPFDFDMAAGTMCGACIEDLPLFDRARAAVTYNEASRQLILGFKYGDRLHTVHSFVPWLKRAGAEMLESCDFIVPVPLHRRRLWQRRFNQSALIAQALASGTGKAALPDALLRLRHTVPQKGLSRKDRAENVKKAFAVNGRHKGMLRGASVVLVDDVYTSGATLNECARMLRAAGVDCIQVLTIARVLKE